MTQAILPPRRCKLCSHNIHTQNKSGYCSNCWQHNSSRKIIQGEKMKKDKEYKKSRFIHVFNKEVDSLVDFFETEKLYDNGKITLKAAISHVKLMRKLVNKELGKPQWKVYVVEILVDKVYRTVGIYLSKNKAQEAKRLLDKNTTCSTKLEVMELK
jgi:predicted amidophosphoribosyltransferase